MSRLGSRARGGTARDARFDGNAETYLTIPDYATGHSSSQNLVLIACPNLLGRTLAAQVSLSGFAKLNLT